MPVVLTLMTAEDYADWLKIIVPEYAAEKVASGAWVPSEAAQRSHDSMVELLPQGRETPGHHLYSLIDDAPGQRLGFLWFGRRDSHAFLYDLYVYPAHRRRGYGRQALRCLATAAATQGFQNIGLHVFAQNTAAAALYRSEGYTVTDLVMRKNLSERD